jgi:hypothetical protein
MNYNLLRGFYPELDNALDKIPHEKIWLIFFARREDKYAVTVAIHNKSEEDRMIIDDLAGIKIPRHIYSTTEGQCGKIGIEVTGVNTDNLRLYVNKAIPRTAVDNFLQGYGYYVNNNGSVIGKKEYSVNVKSVCYDVTYYAADNTIVETDKEIPASYSDWGGPKELVTIAEKNNVKCVFTKKENKNQAYFIMNF